tara:strand:+ start:6101 stop:7129 length:1029 start_codon:yes stop_codon:yes gene_type:complete
MGACQQQEAVESSRWPHSSPVKISSILLKEVQESVTLVGTVEPLKRSLVASEIAGLVEEYPLNEGDLVHKGELLARLRTDTIEIQMKEAVARRREAIARYRKAKFQLNRTRELFRTGTASRQQFEDDEAEELALYERLTQQESKIREYQDQLRMAKILAPFDGWIIEEYSELGQWVAKGGPVVEMLDLSHVQVEVPLPERYVNEVKLADFVVVRFDAVPLREFTGKIFSIVAQANPETRTFPIKIDIPNPDGLIKSGMFSRITLTVGEPYHAMLLPKDAVVLRGGEKFVVVVDEGVATQVAIQSGQHVNHLVEVTGDLSEGMDVVVQGNERLSTGQKVTVIQ